jgi:hypothetical protein
MVLFGSCGIVKNQQAIMMPKMLEAQQEMFRGLSADFETPEMDSLLTIVEDSLGGTNQRANAQLPFRNMGAAMEKMMSMTEFQKTWIVRFGYLGFLVMGLYQLAGIFLLIQKPFSVKLAYVALGTSLVFSIIKTIVMSSDSSFSLISMMSTFGESFGIIFDIALIIVIVTSTRGSNQGSKPNRGTGTGNMPSPSDTLVVD